MNARVDLDQMLDFHGAEALTVGVELELQLLSCHDYNLTRGAPDLLALLARKRHPGAIKPEITESMIELNSSVHDGYEGLLAELLTLRDAVVEAADRLNLGVCGGGTHPFQQWQDRRIYPDQRYLAVSGLYGYLAKQFTVFGQHIHIGCRDGNDAVRMTHLMSRYIPHFIALSAASPFYQSVDTAFASARLNAVNAFPLAGTMPMVADWTGFRRYVDKMVAYGVVRSMKDFYWDIRPKPEYGTIELRICDTPLTVRQAARLAALAQVLVADLREHPAYQPHPDTYLPYSYNRFQACRFGLEANFIDVEAGTTRPLMDDLSETLTRLLPTAESLGCASALRELLTQTHKLVNDADWLRRRYEADASLAHVVQAQALHWRTD